jgi:diadenosine tetraphosphatase ApaH/serine/threonine PP2A family protein phosphatase
MQIKIPTTSLVVIIGADNAAKMAFAQKFFDETEIFSEENTQSIENWQELVAKRLQKGELAAILTHNDTPLLRKGWRALATKCHTKLIGIALQSAEKTNIDFQKFVKNHLNEGYKKIQIIDFEKDIENIEIVRTKLLCDKKDVTGNFDIIGDIHGCFEELKELLEKMGYVVRRNGKELEIDAPENRKVIFVGDLTDRGPNSPDSLRLVMKMVKNKQAYCVCGNHDAKLLRRLSGQNAKLTHGLDLTMEQLEQESGEFREEVRLFLESLVSHYVFDNGNLVVAHAGLREDMQGKMSGKITSFCLYGDTTGESDEYGLPIRLNWAADYMGKAMVIYGHTPVLEAEWQNNTMDIDTGCVFGGKLTALRYPEREIVQVAAKKTYCVHAKPLF